MLFTLCLILASGFWLLTGATVATTIADVELTQRCIRAGTCREGNPLLLPDRKKVYAIQLPLSVVNSYLSWKLREKGKNYWWVPQIALLSARTEPGLASA